MVKPISGGGLSPSVRGVSLPGHDVLMRVINPTANSNIPVARFGCDSTTQDQPSAQYGRSLKATRQVLEIGIGWVGWAYTRPLVEPTPAQLSYSSSSSVLT